MMYPIKNIFSIIKHFILFLLLGLYACKNNPTYEELLALCPYETEFVGPGNYYLKVPLEVLPHKKTYKKGDTITFRMLFSDTIYDLNHKRDYVIKDFPFRPAFSFYKIENDDWVSALKLDNPVIADSVFNTRFVGPGNTGGVSIAVDVRGDTQYKDGFYNFEFQFVMNVPGVYILLVGDAIESLNARDLREGLYPEYQVDFEDKCPDANYSIRTILQGDPHYLDFPEEVQYLDREVFFNDIEGIIEGDNEFWGYGLSKVIAEWSGMFAYEVVE